MRLLIVGAGASYQESISLNLAEKKRLPLLNQIPELWLDWGFYHFNHHKLVEIFMETKGSVSDWKTVKEVLRLPEKELTVTYLSPSKINITATEDMHLSPEDIARDKKVIEKFILEAKKDSQINVERLFEFLWQLKRYDELAFGSLWKNFVRWNLRQPIEMLIVEGFLDKQKENTMFPLVSSQQVIKKLNYGDVVLSLNYDTLFEVALTQAEVSFQYAPWLPSKNQIWVAKPHGSMNMAYIARQNQFGFGSPDCYGHVPLPDQDLTYGLVPPRTNKSYEQNWIAGEILSSIKKISPDIITFWGIGLTESDLDLNKLYRNWSCRAQKVEFINPCLDAADRVSKILKKRVIHYKTLEDWLAA